MARRRPGVAALLVGWLAAFLVFKGMSPLASIEGNSFFRYVMPAWPAYLLLLAAVPLLVPTLTQHLGERVVAAPPGRTIGWRAMAAVLVVGAVVPFLVVTVARPAQSPQDVVLVGEEGSAILLTPVDPSIDVTAARTGRGVLLSWSSRTWRAGTSLSSPANTRQRPRCDVLHRWRHLGLLDMEAIAEQPGAAISRPLATGRSDVPHRRHGRLPQLPRRRRHVRGEPTGAARLATRRRGS